VLTIFTSPPPLCARWGSAAYANAVAAVLAPGACSAVVASWAQREGVIAHRWCCHGGDAAPPVRPSFEGEVVADGVSGRLTVDFPEAHRARRTRATACVSGTLVCLLLAVAAVVFSYKATVTAGSGSVEQHALVSLANAVQITVFGVGCVADDN